MAYDIHYIVMESTNGTDWTTWIAIGISVLALIATGWQGHLSRVHNRLSVRPQLEGHSHMEDGIYSLTIQNDGLGPAILTHARVYYRGILVEGQGPSLIDAAFANVPDCKLLARQFFYAPFVLPAGDSIEVCKVECNGNFEDIEVYLGGLIHLQIDYESAYNEKCPMYETRRPPQTS
ncbi:MAG: hypothetical protein I8H73_30940 [Pseudomonadales bacterium]|nr:hypothetical protein [Pseudomonadales bacterium]